MDRTRAAVERQLQAMGCALLELGVGRAPGAGEGKGRMLPRGPWTPGEVLHSLPWLRRENVGGGNIYTRPAQAEPSGLVLVDDLDQSQVARLRSDGLAPALEVETSPSNFQAWIRLPGTPEPAIRTAASRILARRYGGDVGAVGFRQFGRLAGFTNRKPKHKGKGRNGGFPWVLLRQASGELARAGQAIVAEAQAEIERARAGRGARKPRSSVVAPSVPASACVIQSSGELIEAARRAWVQKFAAAGDRSAADFSMALALARRGAGQDEIEATIAAVSPDLEARKGGSLEDYLARTATKAVQIVSA